MYSPKKQSILPVETIQYQTCSIGIQHWHSALAFNDNKQIEIHQFKHEMKVFVVSPSANEGVQSHGGTPKSFVSWMTMT